VTRSGKTAAHTLFLPARCCFAMPDTGNPGKLPTVAEALGITARTIEHLKERFVEEGIELVAAQPRAKPPKLSFDGAFDARLTALACSPAPAGRARGRCAAGREVVELKSREGFHHERPPRS